MIELRVDPITEDVVVFSEERSKRPISPRSSNDSETKKSDDKDCPFCRGNEEYCEKYTFKIEDVNGWLVKSVHNRSKVSTYIWKT